MTDHQAGNRAQAIAAALDAARKARTLLAPLDALLAPRDEAEGYAAQFALATLQSAVPPAGFKIGATAKGMQDYLGLSGPLAGFMAGPVHQAGAALPFARFVRPGVECEIGFRLGHDIAPGPLSRDQAAAAVAACFPSCEVVENRYTDFKALGGAALAADQVFHASCVIGADSGFDLAALDTLTGRITHDGKELGSGPATALLGHPLAVLQFLADSGAAHEFGGLKAGQVITLGSVTPPFWLDRPGEIEVDFGPLGRVAFKFI